MLFFWFLLMNSSLLKVTRVEVVKIGHVREGSVACPIHFTCQLIVVSQLMIMTPYG